MWDVENHQGEYVSHRQITLCTEANFGTFRIRMCRTRFIATLKYKKYG